MARQTLEDIKQFIINNGRVENVIDIEYRLEKNGRNILWIYLECCNGHKYVQRWSNFKKGCCGCPDCQRYKLSKVNIKYSIHDIEKRCDEKNFIWLNKDKFINGTRREHNNTYLLKCKLCGQITKRNITNLFSERQCVGCINKVKKSTEIMNKELQRVYGDEFEVYGQGNGSRELSKFIHKICGKIFEATHDNLIREKTYCPYCIENLSLGETKIKYYLNQYKINYVPQYKTNKCKYINPLPFDFAIFNNENNKILFLIEYDGRQHFEPANFGGVSDDEALYNFEVQQYKDNIKNQYCLDNNIPLLRIPNWEFDNIEQTIEDWLVKHKLIPQFKNEI